MARQRSKKGKSPLIRRMVIPSVLVLLVCFGRCGTKERQEGYKIFPPQFSDPYVRSFYCKNIKYVILQRTDDPYVYPDTLELDERGNIIRLKMSFYKEYRAYDEDSYLIRRLEVSDIREQYMARYSFRGDTLIQSWRELISHDWHLGSDTTSRAHHINRFVFDREGNVIQEFQNIPDPVFYEYQDGRLSAKKIELLGLDDHFHFRTINHYVYDGDGNLLQILNTSERDMDEDEVIYFRDGLPDSSRLTRWRRLDPTIERFKYQYVFH